MKRKLVLLLATLALLPMQTRPQTTPSASTIALPRTALSDGAADSAIRYVGAGTTRTAEDIGAQIIAAYASLPPTGGTIVVIADPAGRCYNFTTPIVANIPGKYLLLESGSPPTAIRTSSPLACLSYTPTSGTAITLDYVPARNNDHAVLHGIQNLILKNNECETIGGCSSSAVGIALGGANAGAQGARFSGFRVVGFASGISVLRSDLHTRGLAFRDCTISHNSTGVLDAEGDTAQVSFDACQFYGNGTAISSTTSLRISNSRIESSSVVGVLCSAPAACDLNDNHFENGSADSTHFLDGNGIFFVSGGDMRDDRAIGNTDWWAHFAGASFFILGTMLSSTGRTANCVILNEGAGAAALQNNSANILTTLYSSSSLITDLGSTHRLSGDQQHSGGIRADISSSKNDSHASDPGLLSATASQVLTVCQPDLFTCQRKGENASSGNPSPNPGNIIYLDGQKYAYTSAGLTEALQAAGPGGTVVIPSHTTLHLVGSVNVTTDSTTLRCEPGAIITTRQSISMITADGTNGFRVDDCKFAGAPMNAISIKGANGATLNDVDFSGLESGTTIVYNSSTQNTAIKGNGRSNAYMTLPGNQAAKTSFALDRATLSTDPCESVFSVSTHAESRPTYTTTNCSTSPPNKVGIFSETARSGSRKDNIWASNFVVNYDNAGSAQGLEIDFANRYRDYVIGGTDTNAYAGLGVITQGRFQPDKAIAIDRTGVAALWRRGLYVNAVSDRAIEVNGTPSSVLFVTAGQANMTVNGDFTWGFQQSRGAGASPVMRLTPESDSAAAEIFGTNAANTKVMWDITRAGGAVFSSLAINGGPALATSMQSGNGSLCLTTNCALVTPTIAEPHVAQGSFSGPALTNPTIGGGSAINGVFFGKGRLSFTAMAPGSCHEQTIRIPGTSMTGVATANPMTDLGSVNLSWQSRVSAVGVVSIRVCNQSTSSLTPESVIWHVIVVQ